MTMKALRILAAPLAALALTVSATAIAHEGPSEKITVLQDEALKNVPGKKAMMIEVDYKPGQSSIAHKHEGTAMAYVLSGAVISQVKGEKAITYKAGQYWYEPAGSEHLVSAVGIHGVVPRRESVDPLGKLIAEGIAINKKARINISGLFISRRNYWASLKPN
jgi:quercetin dioxygenase-like cupin family protein